MPFSSMLVPVSFRQIQVSLDHRGGNKWDPRVLA